MFPPGEMVEDETGFDIANTETWEEKVMDKTENVKLVLNKVDEIDFDDI